MKVELRGWSKVWGAEFQVPTSLSTASKRFDTNSHYFAGNYGVLVLCALGLGGLLSGTTVLLVGVLLGAAVAGGIYVGGPRVLPPSIPQAALWMVGGLVWANVFAWLGGTLFLSLVWGTLVGILAHAVLAKPTLKAKASSLWDSLTSQSSSIQTMAEQVAESLEGDNGSSDVAARSHASSQAVARHRASAAALRQKYLDK